MIKYICIFGASTTYGCWGREMNGWVNRLQAFLAQDKTKKRLVYNLGVSSDTTTDLLARFKNEAGARKPDIIIFSIGTNDSAYKKTKDNPWTSKKQFNSNWKKIIKQAKKFTKQIIFVNSTKIDESKTQPVLWDSNIYYNNKNIKEYNALTKKIADDNNLLYIDIFNLLKEDDLDDGLHPNAQGHQKMFEQIKEQLIKNNII